MPKFMYEAQDSLGKVVSGSINAETDNEAKELLSLKGFSRIKLRQASFWGFLVEVNAKIEKSTANKSVKIQEIAVVCRQLATLVNAGVSLFESVFEVSAMVQNKYLSSVLLDISKDIKSGKQFSDSLLKYKKIFDNTFVSMIAVGERTGKIGKVLLDLAVYLENNVKLRRKIKSASSYPLFVGIFFVIVFFGIVLVLIPKFQEMFASFGTDLPLPTLIVMKFSNFFIEHLPIVGIVAVVAFIAFKIWTKTSAGLMMWHKFFFKIPIFAPIYTKMLFARFFQTLSTLIQSGVDIVASIQIARDTITNVYIRSVLTTIKDSVVSGQLFSENMEKYKVFPKMVVKMTSVGEKTGQMEEMFSKITDYYNDEVDATVAGLSAVVEPVLIIGLGIMVGICVVALYLPIFNMANAMVSASS